MEASWTKKPYSIDLRERAGARVVAGESVRDVAAVLKVTASSVVKWAQRKRSTGPARWAGTGRGFSLASIARTAAAPRSESQPAPGAPAQDTCDLIIPPRTGAGIDEVAQHGEVGCEEHEGEQRTCGADVAPRVAGRRFATFDRRRRLLVTVQIAPLMY